MVATYDRNGIRFCYPENWKIQEDEPKPDEYCVTLQSPGSGFWMLHVFESVESLQRLAAEVKQSIQREYEEADVEAVKDHIEGTPLPGYDLQFCCLHFVVSAAVRSFSLGDRTCVLLSQAEDSEFEQMAPVFSAITTSLIQEANSSNGD
ncbi:MAG: hypothetical protein ACQESR_01305 [Planctomycetota bacterium]